MEEPTKTQRKTKVPKATKEEIEQEEQGSQNGGKFSLGKLSPIILPLILAIVVSYMMVNLTAVPKGTYNNAVMGISARLATIEASLDDAEVEQNTLTTSIQTLTGKIDSYTPSSADKDKLASLETELKTLKAEVAGLPTSTVTGAEITALEVRIADIEELLEGIEIPGDVETEDATRWELEPYATNHIDAVSVTYDISPYRIEEEDDYSVVVTIVNNTTTTFSDMAIEVALRPEINDRVMIDEDETYLDTTHSPYYFWDIQVVKRSDDTCRRVVFKADGIKVMGGTGEGSEFVSRATVLRLNLTLAYK